MSRTLAHHGERLQASRDFRRSTSSLAARPVTIARRSRTIAAPNVMKDARSIAPVSHRSP